MARVIVAECARCELRWLIEANCAAHLMEGICGRCQGESDVAARPLTFRSASVNDLEVMWPAIKSGEPPIMIDELGYPARFE